MTTRINSKENTRVYINGEVLGGVKSLSYDAIEKTVNLDTVRLKSVATLLNIPTPKPDTITIAFEDMAVIEDIKKVVLTKLTVDTDDVPEATVKLYLA